MTSIGAPIKVVKVPEPRPEELPVVVPSRRREEEEPIPVRDWPRRAPAEKPANAPEGAR